MTTPIPNTTTTLTTPSQTLSRLSTMCNKVASRVSKCVRDVSLGVMASSAISPISFGTTFIAQHIGIIQKLEDSASLVSEGARNLEKLGYSFIADRLADADCPMHEFVQQWNKLHRYHPHFQQTVMSVKVSMAASIGIILPVCEEILFRGLMQEVLLKKIPKYILSKIAHEKETYLNSTIAKVTRITLSAGAFSAYHLTNSGFMPESYVSAQIAGTFILGIGCGILQENVGLFGAIGAHAANNIMAISPRLLSC